MTSSVREHSSAEPAGRPALSPLAADVLAGIAAGHSTGGLAARLVLSVRGVEYHCSRLMRMLKAANRAEMIARAYTAGILSADEWPPRVGEEFIH
ncbi:LuxR C-terminal-related transcriptional regulator [Amycolatopsis sp. NPDC059027]|uniref:LuxR C-terminal-related transcriptional regulator n=1 Tax=unclassified Amycolatopsis TaxID=2618356 RepID=UPI0036728F08